MCMRVIYNTAFTEIRADLVRDDALGPSGRRRLKPVPGMADRVQDVSLGVLAHLLRVERAAVLPRGHRFARLHVRRAEYRRAQVHQTVVQVRLGAVVHLVLFFVGGARIGGLRVYRRPR